MLRRKFWSFPDARIVAHFFKAVVQLGVNLAQHLCMVGVGSHALEAVGEQLMQAQQRGALARHHLTPVKQGHLVERKDAMVACNGTVRRRVVRRTWHCALS